MTKISPLIIIYSIVTVLSAAVANGQIVDGQTLDIESPTINPITSDVFEGRTFNMTAEDTGALGSTLSALYCSTENCNPDTLIPIDDSGPLKDLMPNPDTVVRGNTTHEILALTPGEYRVGFSATRDLTERTTSAVNVTVIQANNWSNWGGDRNRSGFTFGTVPNYQYYDSAGLKDELNFGTENIEQNPVITSGGIFFQAASTFYAYDHRGNQMWSAENPTYTSAYGHPATSNNVVVYGTYDSVVARNATNGNLMWTFSAPSFAGTFDEISPLISNGRVWFGAAFCISSACRVYALNLTSGALIWQFAYPTANTSIGGTSFESRYIEPGATISDGRVYFSAVHGEVSGEQRRSTVIALNESNGNEMLWGINLSNEFDVTRYNAISVRGNSLYVGVHNLESASTGNLSYLLALNKTNGQQLWRYNFSDVNQFPERVLPVYYGDKIVVSTTDFSNSKIYALNATTGTLIWQYDVTGEDMWSGPSVADSKVVFGTGAGQKVYALSSLNGSLLWTVNAGNSVYSTPALIDDAVYIGVDGGKVLRLRANTTHSNENVQFTAGQVTTVDGVMNSDISVDIHATSSGTGEMHLRKYPMPPNTTNAFGETKLGKYMKITHQNVLNNMDWAVIKLFYTDDDIVALELNESALALLRWNGSAWTCPSTCGVNTVDNYAWINTTSFSTFGMSGGMPSQGGVLEKIDALIDKVKSLDIDGGLKQSLLAKLNAARDAFLRGNIKAAINQLEAFIDEVEAQRGKKIREADADMLISMAKEIIKMLRT